MQTVEFQINWGSDNTLNVIADVTPGSPAKTNSLPEDAYPAEPAKIDILDCRIVDANNPDAPGIPFDHIGLGVWNRITKKYSSLEDWITEEAIQQASDAGEE